MSKKRIAKAMTSVFLFVVLLLNCMVIALPTAEAAVVSSGKCGENVSWQLESNGTFTVYGTGPMKDYSVSDKAPWYAYESPVKKLVIKSGVTAVGAQAFRDCKNLASISIANTVTTIGNDAFAGCGISLKHIIIPESVITIGEDAFASCNNLETISLPDGITTIGARAFAFCYKIKNITLPSSMESISQELFKDCKVLEEITIPASVKTVDMTAFKGCLALKEVVIPETVMEVSVGGMEAEYHEIEKLTFLNKACKITGSLRSFRGGTIYGYDDSTAARAAKEQLVTFVSLGEAERKVFVSGTCGENLTWTLDNYGLLTISGTGAMEDFAYNGPWYRYQTLTDGLKKIVVEEGVTTIGTNAFREGKYSLVDISLPTTIEKINEDAFSGCWAIEKLVVSKADCEIHDSILLPCATVFYGYEGSTVQAFAERHGFDFVNMSVNIVTGDADLDGVVTATDARLALRNAVGLEKLNAMQITSADTDGDAVITAGDARLILRISVGLE